MPVEITTTNNAFRVPTAANNGSNFGIGLNDFATDVDTMWQRGTLVSRPAASSVKAGTVYYTTDTAVYYVSNGTAWQALVLAAAGATGATNIATSQSTSSASYTTLATPDQVTGIVMPTNGLVRIWYQAQCSATAASNAAIFIGSNQLQVMGNDGTTHGPLATSTVISNSNTNALFTYPLGVMASNSGSAYSADATTGQAVGFFNQGGAIAGIQAGANAGQTFALESSAGVGSVLAFGGPCDVFAAAGTYTISVQFKSTGTVTALNRKLWVQTVPFS